MGGNCDGSSGGGNSAGSRGGGDVSAHVVGVAAGVQSVCVRGSSAVAVVGLLWARKGGDDAQQPPSCRDVSLDRDSSHGYTVSGHCHCSGHYQLLAGHGGEHAEPKVQRHW